jgi:predicted nucleic acid-binding protein
VIVLDASALVELVLHTAAGERVVARDLGLPSTARAFIVRIVPRALEEAGRLKPGSKEETSIETRKGGEVRS